MSRMFALNILLLPLHLFLHTVMQLFGRYCTTLYSHSATFWRQMLPPSLLDSVHTASYCTSVRPRRGIPPLWLFPSFLSFSSLESRTEAVVFVQIVKPIKDYVICYYINEIDLT